METASKVVEICIQIVPPVVMIASILANAIPKHTIVGKFVNWIAINGPRVTK